MESVFLFVNTDPVDSDKVWFYYVFYKNGIGEERSSNDCILIAHYYCLSNYVGFFRTDRSSVELKATAVNNSG